MVRLSQVDMGRALTLAEAGHTQRQIAAMIGSNRSVINRLLARNEETGTSIYRHGGGRQRVTTPREDRQLVQEVRRQPRLPVS